jgi:membrane protein DedA with SNARE-associated domain
MNKMRWKTFLFYNALGGVVWSLYISLLGFFAGRLLHDNFEKVESLVRIIGGVGLGLCVALAIGMYVVFRVRRARARRVHITETEVEPVAAAHSPSSASKVSIPNGSQ